MKKIFFLIHPSMPPSIFYSMFSHLSRGRNALWTGHQSITVYFCNFVNLFICLSSSVSAILLLQNLSRLHEYNTVDMGYFSMSI